MILLSSCGQKSTVKSDVEANGLKEPISLKIVVPLTEETIATFDSPVENTFPLLRGLVKSVFDLGASLGAGKVKLSLLQPLPEIPSKYIKDIRIKRVFFYMEPKKVEKVPRTVVGKVFNDIWKFIKRDREMSFDFLDRLAVTLKSEEATDRSSWVPAVTTPDFTKKDKDYFAKLFTMNSYSIEQMNLSEKDETKVMIKYDKDKRDNYLKTKSLGRIYILYTDDSVKTRRLIEDDPRLANYYTRIHTLSKALLIELPKDPILQEGFEVEFWEKQDQLNIKNMEACTEKICLDFKIADINLVPLLEKRNGIKIDSFIDAGRTPESFQLKGFMEFEIKVQVKADV
jgi:hypothetical protein